MRDFVKILSSKKQEWVTQQKKKKIIFFSFFNILFFFFLLKQNSDILYFLFFICKSLYRSLVHWIDLKTFISRWTIPLTFSFRIDVKFLSVLICNSR